MILNKEYNMWQYNDNELAHYGVLGMKWGRRKDVSSGVKELKRSTRNLQRENQHLSRYKKEGPSSSEIKKMDTPEGRKKLQAKIKKEWDNEYKMFDDEDFLKIVKEERKEAGGVKREADRRIENYKRKAKDTKTDLTEAKTDVKKDRETLMKYANEGSKKAKKAIAKSDTMLKNDPEGLAYEQQMGQNIMGGAMVAVGGIVLASLISGSN